MARRRHLRRVHAVLAAWALVACGEREPPAHAVATAPAAPQTAATVAPSMPSAPSAASALPRPPAATPRPTHPCAPPQGALHPDCLAFYAAGAPEVPACPASFAAATESSSCGFSPKTKAKTCSYPEGNCECSTSLYCGGPAPEALQLYGMRWRCRAKPKPGECPLTLLPNGRCATPGLSCAKDTTSCSRGMSCTCRGGVWRCKEVLTKPQP